MSDFFPFPELQSERLRLREIQPADADMVLHLRSDAEITRFIDRPEDRKTRNIDDALAFIDFVLEAGKNGDSVTWVICTPSDDKMRGSICLWNFAEDRRTAEVGYDLAAVYQGQGVMNEAMARVLNYAFGKLQLNVVEAYTHRDNSASVRLLKRHGFRQLEDRRDEENTNNLIFAVTKAE